LGSNNIIKFSPSSTGVGGGGINAVSNFTHSVIAEPSKHTLCAHGVKRKDDVTNDMVALFMDAGLKRLFKKQLIINLQTLIRFFL
jgi:hypothetical protein